jgi:hypothetical protein
MKILLEGIRQRTGYHKLVFVKTRGVCQRLISDFPLPLSWEVWWSDQNGSEDSDVCCAIEVRWPEWRAILHKREGGAVWTWSSAAYSCIHVSSPHPTPVALSGDADTVTLFLAPHTFVHSLSQKLLKWPSPTGSSGTPSHPCWSAKPKYECDVTQVSEF